MKIQKTFKRKSAVAWLKTAEVVRTVNGLYEIFVEDKNIDAVLVRTDDHRLLFKTVDGSLDDMSLVMTKRAKDLYKDLLEECLSYNLI